jgi:hypothetical protein
MLSGVLLVELELGDQHGADRRRGHARRRSDQRRWTAASMTFSNGTPALSAIAIVWMFSCNDAVGDEGAATPRNEGSVVPGKQRISSITLWWTRFPTSTGSPPNRTHSH